MVGVSGIHATSTKQQKGDYTTALSCHPILFTVVLAQIYI